jgi:glycosyltransferase involved in cell wall biosynthesis
LAEYYSIADVVMNLSYQETFGMTTVEGFGCGTPSVVYDRTASPELISQYTGIIVEAADMRGILSAIETIRRNGKLHYSAACRQRAVEFYNKDDKFREYIRLYNELVSKDK